MDGDLSAPSSYHEYSSDLLRQEEGGGAPNPGVFKAAIPT